MSVSSAMSFVALEEQIAALEEMDLSALRLRWVELAKARTKISARTLQPPMPAQPPKVSAGVLRLALAYQLQCQAKGGLPKTVARQLVGGISNERAYKARSTPKPLPGTRLVRVWQARTHIVTIGDKGTIRWNERDWPSLSAVAKAITGTHWSGPKFFGLRGAA